MLDVCEIYGFSVNCFWVLEVLLKYELGMCLNQEWELLLGIHGWVFMEFMIKFGKFADIWPGYVFKSRWENFY